MVGERWTIGPKSLQYAVRNVEHRVMGIAGLSSASPTGGLRKDTGEVRRRPRLTARLGASALFVLLAVVAACAPPPPPGAAPAPTTTTVVAAPSDPASSYYVISGIRPRSTYTLTFMAGVPVQVQESFQRAATQVTQLSGITFVSGAATGGAWAATGEMRVRIGALCSGNENGSEAGCAKTLYMVSQGSNLSQMSEISVTTRTSTAGYLDAVTFHELAHAVGLSHVDYRPDAPQIMNPVVNPSILTYQAGDREGLRVSGTTMLNPTEMAQVFPEGYTDMIDPPSRLAATLPSWVTVGWDVEAHQVSLAD